MIERSYRQPKQAEPAVEPAPPEHQQASPLIAMQRRAGNAATLAAIGAQGKLKVGAADDPAEREADRVARQVTAALADGGSVAPGTKDKKGEGTIGRILQRRAAIGAEGGDVDTDLERDITSARSGGAPLEPDVRRSMEQGFGADFSAVRVHTGPASAELNRQVQAKAFTIGNDVFFGSGGPDTSSKAGTELLAHELTHVVQQDGAEVGRTIQRSKADEEKESESSEGDALEEAKSEAEEEVEGDESESSESGAPESAPTPAGPIAGTLPSGSGSGFEVIKDPGEETADVAGARRKAAAKDTAGRGTAVKLAVGGAGIHTTTPKSATATDKSDALGANLGKVSWANPGGMAVKAFGSESFKVSYTKASYKQDGPGQPITLNFDLDVNCPWGVNPGGRIDIPSAASPNITADTVDQIVHDLTPVKKEKSWRAPRDVYWSQAICERHEKFHSTDDESWAKGAGKDRFVNFLNAKTINIAPGDVGKKDVLAGKLIAALDSAVADMKVANMEFYTGGAGSYLSYAGEERAFGDGKQPYLELADAIKARGDVLKAEQAQNAQESGTSVKDKAKFFDRVGKSR
jgi:hypothetical protein